MPDLQLSLRKKQDKYQQMYIYHVVKQGKSAKPDLTSLSLICTVWLQGSTVQMENIQV